MFVRSMRAIFRPSVAFFVLPCLSMSVFPAVAQQDSPRSASEIAEALTGEVAEIRGLPFLKPVPVSEIDDEQAREYMAGRIAKFLSPGQIAATERVYKVLGLVPEEVDLLETLFDVLGEQAGGFYDPDTKSFFVLADIPPGIAPVVIAHELTHALEDQHFDLDERLLRHRNDDDRLLAHSAVHEGTATLLMMIYMTRAVLRGEIDAQVAQTMAASEMGRAEVLESLPEVFRRQLLAPYVLGSSFVARGDLLGAVSEGFPVEAANVLYEDPPLSSEQILHPAKYWEAERRDDPRPVDLGDAGKTFGRSWRLHAEGTLGELTIGSMVGAATPGAGDLAVEGEGWTNEAASGWGGDRWQLWRSGDAQVVTLGILWDSPQDAQQFVEALPTVGGRIWQVSGDAVAIIAGDLPPRRDRVLQRMLEAMVPSEAGSGSPPGAER